MRKVLITPVTLADRQGHYLKVLQDAGFEPVFPDRPEQLTEEELLAVLPGVWATIAGSEPYTARVLERAADLHVIARAGVGYDAVDLDAANRFGVVVTIAPGTNHDAVAEHTFALMLALAKGVVRQHQAVVSGQWGRTPTMPLRGQTLGIVGLGRIGKAVALRGKAFLMQVVAYETQPDEAFVRQHEIELLPLEEVLRRADYVSLHVPLTPQTRHMIARHTLALMKPGAFLINTARGALVCEEDLYDALRSGHLAGAGLDVFEQEPCRHSPLFSLDNVVCTAHTAGVDQRSREEMSLAAAASIVALAQGQWPEAHIVNPGVRAAFERRRRGGSPLPRP
ncbi:MAG: hydroxyacid dehydrogenase [Gemmataceae bacterium]|mgnify:CR=1 FL=1